MAGFRGAAGPAAMRAIEGILARHLRGVRANVCLGVAVADRTLPPQAAHGGQFGETLAGQQKCVGPHSAQFVLGQRGDVRGMRSIRISREESRCTSHGFGGVALDRVRFDGERVGVRGELACGEGSVIVVDQA
jgi:hypothetical protein